MHSHRCNICLRRSSLTNEHVFPKSITQHKRRLASGLGKRLGILESKGRLYQSGYKASTACDQCNCELLGADLDKALADLYQKTSTELSYLKFVPKGGILVRNVNLTKAIRSVAGHLLASDEKPNARGKSSKNLRRFVFGRQLYPETKVGIWIYPHQDQVVIKNAALMDLKLPFTPFVLHAYKTYPISVMFAFAAPDYQFPYPIIDVTDFLNDPSQLSSVRFMLDRQVHRLWPEAPTDNGMVLYGDDSGLQTEPATRGKKYPY